MLAISELPLVRGQPQNLAALYARPRDSQRSKIYAFDKELKTLLPQTLTLQEIEQLVRRIWRDYEIRCSTPTIGDGRGARRGKALYHKHMIVLPRFARTNWYALHEIAHILTPWSAAHHGPEFASIYAQLLERYAGVQQVRSKMRQHKIKIA